MFDGVEIEAAGQFAVHAGEEVAGKGGGDAGGIVVGRFKQRRILDQIDAEKELVLGAEDGGEPAKKVDPFVFGEVAEGAAEKDGQSRRGVRQHGHRIFVRAVDADHPGLRMPFGNAAAGLQQGAVADIDRNVADNRIDGEPGAQQMVGLYRAAGTEFDQTDRPAEGTQARRDTGENRRFGAGRVIFRLLGDLFVELAAMGIVQKTTFQAARLPAQAGRYRMGKVEGLAEG